MILLLAIIGAACWAASGSDSKNKPKTSTRSSKSVAISPTSKLDLVHLTEFSLSKETSRTFKSFDSGYDSVRKVWWTREDTITIENL